MSIAGQTPLAMVEGTNALDCAAGFIMGLLAMEMVRHRGDDYVFLGEQVSSEH
jgi:hypothetical protein